MSLIWVILSVILALPSAALAQATDTGLQSPTANAAETSSAGDNNGFETNPSNAHTNDSLNAVDTNSGSGTSTSCTATSKDKHRFYNYGFDTVIPGGSTINGIRVRLDAKVDSTSGSPKICVQLSWDGGTTWTTAKTTSTLTTTMSTYTPGGATDIWGRAWGVNDFSNTNFRVRVINVASSTSRDFTLDWVAVRVFYTVTAPSISGLSPTSGPVGTSITISGANFGATQGTSTVTFNGTSATPTSWSNTSIVAPVPSGATTGPVVVTINGQASNGVTFTVTVPPSISSLTPISGPVGTSVTISGSNFGATQGTSTVTFNGAAATPTSWSDTAIVATVPAGATTGPVVITVGGLASNGVGFTVNNDTINIYDELGRLTGVVDPAGETATYIYDAVGNLLSISRQSSALVSIIEFTPNSGPAGTTVTIYGTGFSTTPSQNTVTFNGTAATVTSSTATQIVTTVPTGATTGPINVTTPTGSATSSASFTVTTSTGVPTITSFAPTIGTSGTSVTITGTNFETILSNNKVKFNISYATISSATATTINTTVPTSTGSGRISVETPYGKAVSADDFFIPPSPYTAADVEVTGRMNIGESKTVTITTDNKMAMILFDGTAGQRISMKISNVTIRVSDVYIYNPDGTTLASMMTQSVTDPDFMDTKVLPATGTYTIFIDPWGNYDSAGSMTLTLYDVPPDVTGTITIGGPSVTVTITTYGQNARLTFDGTAGQRISMKISNVTIRVSDVYIYNPDGTTLASMMTQSVTDPDFMDTKVLPATGTYTIFIDPWGNYDSAGSMTLTLYDVPPDVTGTITPGGPSVTVDIIAPGQNARLTFEGIAGQQVSLKIDEATDGYTSVYIYNPDGTVLSSVWATGSTAFIDTKTLSAPGTHTILVDPNDSATGSVTLTLYDVVDVTGTITIGGPPVTVTTTAPGQNARVTFEGTAGQQITVRVTNNTMGTVTVTLLQPDGTSLTSSTSSSSSFNLATQTLPVTGTYTISIDPSGTNTGSMDVSVTSP
jgi:YD repeat-containing protein